MIHEPTSKNYTNVEHLRAHQVLSFNLCGKKSSFCNQMMTFSLKMPTLNEKTSWFEIFAMTTGELKLKANSSFAIKSLDYL